MFSPSSRKLLLTQSVFSLSVIPFLIFASWKWIAVMLLFYVLYAGVGVAMGFHRTLSHNSIKFHPLVRNLIVILGSLANVGSALTWVSIHRAHHRYCDTPKDPHSPLHKSAFFVLFLSMFAKVSVRNVTDLLRDPFIIFLHKYYFLVQLPWITVLGLIGGWQAIFACHVIPGALTWLGGSFLNWFNHKHGYRNIETQDTSRNHWLTAILVLGEGWHNNHHAKPIAATTQLLKHEFDLIYHLSKLLGGKPILK